MKANINNGNISIAPQSGIEALLLRDWERENIVDGKTISLTFIRDRDGDDPFLVKNVRFVNEFVTSPLIHLAKRGTNQTVCGLETTAEYTEAIVKTYIALNPKTKKNDIVKMTLEKHAVDCPLCKKLIDKLMD